MNYSTVPSASFNFKTLLLCFCLFVTIGLSGYTQSFDAEYSIMAVSGLNLREKPDLASKRLATLPFGANVMATNEHLLENNPNSEIEIEIEGVKGHWLHIEYKGFKGYVFSGFTQRGHDRIVPSQGNLNKDYRLMREGYHCGLNSINYSADLYWYALIIDEGDSRLEKVNISIKMSGQFSELEWEEATGGDGLENLVKVETDIGAKSFLLIGSKDKLESSGAANLFFPIQSRDQEVPGLGRFIYPEQKIPLYNRSFLHEVGAVEQIIQDSSGENFRREYNIHYEIRGNFKAKADLSDELGLTDPAKRHALYQTPLLVWAGDLNNDGLLDLIFSSHTMADHCGVTWGHQLFVTNRDANTVIKKVASYEEGGCH